ncbi:PREDICTED: apoptosis-stimulating of p53 protein 1 isoform X2 [Nicrophorus vespilloides]|uniref:Apoptosis-stimulating of p53 protein 1 isoform X2 n=1 Tax=Nicrophorus vespilloides TaxID=110193 RepID=A0ABM1M146_NICVS|nr:PREDICTED: apoptosis-stimulating of p53 protein 1 isoform X2 [Nicrophorus vespilloides]
MDLLSDKIDVEEEEDFSTVVSVTRTALLKRALQFGGLKPLPDGVQLTLSELRDMACRQQAQIESQHQLLAAKEQRLRYLKEQEARQQRVQAESERLRRLRDRVDAQELKLRKLRAIRGQVDHQKQNNISLTSDLDSIRALFNEKEKELSLAVAKVDELTKQLEELRRGRSNRDQPPASALELDKLRRELMYRNKLNEQQNHRLNQQREALTARQEEMSAIDKRISELQERLHRKRLLNQQLANQISAASHKATFHQYVRLPGSTDQNNQGYPRKPQPCNNHPTNGLSRSNIAAVEPYNHVPLSAGQPVRHGPLQENTTYHPVYQQNHHIKSDSEPKQETEKIANYGGQDADLLKDFNVSKSDPKYQTLPYNTKFTVNLVPNKKLDGQDQDVLKESDSHNGNIIQSQMVHSAPLNILNKNIATPLNQNDLINKRNDKENDDRRHFTQNGNKMHDNNNMVNNNTTMYQKPISSVAPTSVHHSGKLSNIYQTSSIKVQPVEPQTILSTTKQTPLNSSHIPLLSPPQSTSTPVATPDNSSSDKTPKPALPPKPAIKPPPRQTQQPFEDNQVPPPLPLTEPPEEKPSATLSLALSKLQGNFSQMTINTNQKGTPQGSPSTNSPVQQHSPATSSPVLQHSPQLPLSNSSSSSSANDNMPIIKAKPLTIKKQMLSEQPKLRTLTSYSRLNGLTTTNRRIEMPSVINFPEPEPKAADETDKMESSNENKDGSVVVRRCKKGNLKQDGKANLSRRVSFDPLALLLDASLEGELELVKKTATQVANPSAANDEGITALHNAICAGHLEIVKFLVEFGCDVNAQDSDGWTPLHCAASCNNVAMVRFLVEHGACIFATTLSDHETAAEKCEEDEEGFDGCSEYLYSVQEKLGILSGGAVFSVFEYAAQQPDELSFTAGQQLTVLRKGDESEREWWWSRLGDKEGYVPRNLLGLYPRVSKVED